MSPVWNFCACSRVFILQGSQWWCHEKDVGCFLRPRKGKKKKGLNAINNISDDFAIIGQFQVFKIHTWLWSWREYNKRNCIAICNIQSTVGKKICLSAHRRIFVRILELGYLKEDNLITTFFEHKRSSIFLQMDQY